MKANVQKKKITGNGFLLLITIALFVVMYVAGMIVFADKGFAKPQMFLNLFVSNAGLLVIACGLTIVMITGGIDISEEPRSELQQSEQSQLSAEYKPE